MRTDLLIALTEFREIATIIFLQLKSIEEQLTQIAMSDERKRNDDDSHGG